MSAEAHHAGELRQIADAFIAATNAFDVEAALALFANSAVIDDPSTGRRFEGHDGVRDYVGRFFVGYQTVTSLLSFELTGNRKARLRVDFSGDFGHEVGLLEILTDPAGQIVRIDADLE
jgi:ketosteroid isomerase-like protein